MEYIVLKSEVVKPIRFKLYRKEAPLTCEAITEILPLKIKLFRAKISGEEIWTPKGPKLKIPQENATIRLKVGELGYAPLLKRSDISNAIALVYGKARLWDCVNVFAKVFDNDLKYLKKFGKEISVTGSKLVKFELVS